MEVRVKKGKIKGVILSPEEEEMVEQMKIFSKRRFSLTVALMDKCICEILIYLAEQYFTLLLDHNLNIPVLLFGSLFSIGLDL